MKAIILAGGKGVRLQSVINHCPKPMAPIGGKPFLTYVLDHLSSYDVNEIIFSVHHQREHIQQYFKSQYLHMSVRYAIEEEALGTGGAIRHALSIVKSNDPFIVLNGDTLLHLDIKAMIEQHLKQKAQLTMALRSVDDGYRYGKVEVNHDHVVTHFSEKGQQGAGLINAGFYVIDPHLFSSFTLPQSFSFETEFLMPFVASIKPQAFMTRDYFIDIGIPEDYARAQKELLKV